MNPKRRSPLFPAVVLAGASLSLATGACGSDPDETTPQNGDASTSSVDDAKAPDAASEASDAAAQSDACPPGSELPTPPCYLIR